MLLELEGLLQKDGDVVCFTNWLQQALTAEADVKRLQQKTTFLILNIEEFISVEEITQTVGATGQVIIQKMRDGANGQGTGM